MIRSYESSYVKSEVVTMFKIIIDHIQCSLEIVFSSSSFSGTFFEEFEADWK